MLTGFCGALFSGQLCAGAILGQQGLNFNKNEKDLSTSVLNFVPQVLIRFDLIWRKFQMDRKVNLKRAREGVKVVGEFVPYYS